MADATTKKVEEAAENVERSMSRQRVSGEEGHVIPPCSYSVPFISTK